MPLYEFECHSCRRRFERIQKFSDPLPSACPECGGGVRKLPSSPAIQFKGSGWYITDYARRDGGAKPDRPQGQDGSDGASGGKPAGDAATKGSSSDSTSSSAPAASAPAGSQPKSS